MSDDTNKRPGLLYLAATPIGNLQDITLRVLECLKAADYIAVENVSRSRKLLAHYGIKKSLLVFRESNRERRGREILERVKAGASIVLITDAGLPAISDPGNSLLEMAVRENIPLTVLPGPSAALTALLLSGFPSRRFVYWGFLSTKKKQRAEELLAIACEDKTAVFYEAPHRLLKTLAELENSIGERQVAVCRELTKRFEEVQRGTPAELRRAFLERAPRGEITVVVAPGSRPEEELLQEEEIEIRLQEQLDRGVPPAEAVKRTARASVLARSDVYALMLKLRGKRDGNT